MPNRAFTFRENLFLRFLAVLALLGFYYQLFMEPLSYRIDEKEQAKSAVEAELEIQYYMAQKKEGMLEQIESRPADGEQKLGVYSNLNNEIKELDSILAAAKTYNLSFSQAEVSDRIVRRDIFISYQAHTYGQACDIIEAIEHGGYQCRIKEARLSRGGGEEGGAGLETVQGNLLVTYYETAAGARGADGLAWGDDFTGGGVWNDERDREDKK